MGNRKNESVVGAITQTTGKVFERAGVVTYFGSALAGQLLDVITYTSSGQLGEEDPKIIIRSQTSWNSSSPLILVDGIERSMSDVDILFVERISVLKDASATDVYGVHGANGVILITTKREKEGKANIQVRANATMRFPSKLPEKYDSYNTLMLRNRSIENQLDIYSDNWESYIPVDIVNKYRNPANIEEAERYPNVDWADALLKKNAKAYNASVNVSGGTKFVKYFAAVDFLNEGDVFKTVDNGGGYDAGFSYNRINVRSNLDFQLTNTTKFSSNLFGTNGTKKTPWDFEGSFPWAAIYRTVPNSMYPVYSDGVWGFYFPKDADQPNSVYQLANSGSEKQTTTKITTDFSLKQDLKFITKGLSFEGTYSYDNSFLEVDRGINNKYKYQQQKWINPDTGEILYRYPLDSSTQFDYTNKIEWTAQAGNIQKWSTFRRQYYSMRLNFARDFGKHTVTGLGLFSREKSARGDDFAHFREDWVVPATFSIDTKYLFEVNGAYNGSEKFGPENRFDFLPSVSAGWVISQENFMSSLSFVAISCENEVTPIVIDEQDYEGVEIVSEWFVNDIQKVTGKTTQIYQKELPQSKNIILIGILGKNRWIDELIKDRKIDIKDIHFIPNKYKDAFDQLVLFPTNACCNLYEMYYAAAKNKQLAKNKDPKANYWADVTKACFDRDSLFTIHYNQQIAGGKWNHQMDQIRIGYKSWAEPKHRIMPKVVRFSDNYENSDLVFEEADGYVSIEAANYQFAKGADKIHWEVVPDLGKTDSAITTFPQNEYPTSTDSVYLEYAIDFKSTGMFDVSVLVSPTLNFNANKGLRYAISVDGKKEQIININKDYNPWDMDRWQANRINITKSKLLIDTIGLHKLRIRVLEPGIVLQKIMIDTGGIKPSFLGAPQSKQIRLGNNEKI